MIIEERKMRRPSFQFYPADWLNDVNLAVCSLAAQGLWIKLLCLMHQGNPYGYLTDTSGKTLLIDHIHALIRPQRCRNFAAIMHELVTNNVISMTEGGTYFSRRMVRDEEKRLKFSEFGKRGGNPGLTPPVNPPKKSTPPSSSSSSPSPSPSQPPPTPRKGAAPEFDAFWLAYPKKAGKQDALRVWNRVAPSPDLVVKIMASLESHKRSDKWLRGFIKDASGWLNGRRWEDELELPQPSSNIPSAEETRRQMEEFA